MRVAVFHNFLDNIGGAEIVSLTLARELDADIYTTNIDKEKISKMGFEDVFPRIFSIGKVPTNAPFRQQAALFRFRLLNLGKKYDFYIISGDWAMSGAVKNKPNLWYVHSPIREIWDLKDYTKKGLSWWQKPIFEAWVLFNRYLNRKYFKSVDKIVCNSENTKKRIKEYFNKEAEVIYPPIAMKKLHYKKTGNFWLSVNRLVPHKRIDLQLEAFKNLPKEKLIIIGSYEQSRHFKRYAEYCKKMKTNNVKIKSWVDRKELINLYSNCKGFITTSKDEDFGMNVVEAMASGKPVIAPNEGGYKETIINGKTGILIDNINENKIINAVKEIELNLNRDPEGYKNRCSEQAQNFDKKMFIKKIKKQIFGKKDHFKHEEEESLFLVKSHKKIISHKHKFIWFVIAKNGSSSTKNALASILGIDMESLPILRGTSNYMQYPDYFKFTFTRNPWDRLVSCYFDKIRDKSFENSHFKNGIPNTFVKFGVFKGDMTFDEFVRAVAGIPDEMADAHFASQYAGISNRKGELVVDFLGKFENLSEDFNMICKKLNIAQSSKLPHMRKTASKKNHYSKYYTEELKKIVEERYKKDIEMFGYKFETEI